MKSCYGVLVFNNGGMDLGIICALLEADEFKIHITSKPLEAIHILRHEDIDIILASTHLEGMEGQEFKELVEKIKPGISIFLIPYFTAGMNGIPSQCQVNLNEFIAFIQNHLKAGINRQEEQARFKDFFFTFTERLLQIFDAHDNYFFNNNSLVADLSCQVAKKMVLDESLIDSIRLAALLRDVGKIGIQHDILAGKEPLNTDSIDLMKLHPLYSIQLFKDILFPWSVGDVIRHHHEHYDGTGYPDGLKGRYIPLGSRILALVEAYVAMTSERPYRKAFTEEVAIREVVKQAGSQFDPEVIEVFLSLLQEQMKTPLSTRKLILILDSDDSASAYIRLNLDTVEYDTFIATSSSDALAYLESVTPEIIIADLDTLKNDGVNLFDFYNATGKNTAIPFITIVSKDDLGDYSSEENFEFIIKPVAIDTLNSILKDLSKDVAHDGHHKSPERVSLGMSGSLEYMGIADIIQILSMGMKTARVTLKNGKHSGEVYLGNGKVIHVKLGNMWGKEAFFELIGWDKGEFRIFHNQSPDKVNVTMETMALLMEATRLLDEKNKTPRMVCNKNGA